MTEDARSDAPSSRRTGRAVRVEAPAADAARLAPAVVPQAPPRARAGEAVIEVRAAGVNPSDAKAALGAMPHAVWPRTPGRDYAGIVVDGPESLRGRRVWGCGGDLGIRRDGSHAGWLVVPAASVRELPPGLSLCEASAVGVPFVTAWEGLRRAGLPGPGDTVVVCGANGAVGQAAAQIARHRGAAVIAVVRSAEAAGEVPARLAAVIDASCEDVAQRVRALTDGRGADIVFNTVGSPYFDAANKSLALRGRQVFIATLERAVPFDIFAFYRGQHSYHGIDSLALDCTACAGILEQLAPGFSSGGLRAFEVEPESVHAIGDAAAAYRRVLAGARQRLVIAPWGTEASTIEAGVR